jgi:hypothetical protein
VSSLSLPVPLNLDEDHSTERKINEITSEDQTIEDGQLQKDMQMDGGIDWDNDFIFAVIDQGSR